MYERLANGEIRRISDGARFWPDDASNHDAVAYAAWLGLGNSPATAEGDPTNDYRALRKRDYIAELGKAPGSVFEDTTGDVLDILITELVMRGQIVTPEFGAMVQKIVAIKTRHPKPE